MIRKHFIFFVLLLLLIVSTTWAQERALSPVTGTVDPNIRQALVIGNSEYRHAGRLRNPVNDARAIGSTLQQLGFDVTLLTDADQRKMERTIREFGDQLRQRKGVGLFYYAGHGMQFDGENYLLPTDINPSTEEDVSYDAVPLGKLLAQMRAAGNGMNVVILDACRNNPFARSFRTFNPGLAQVNAAAGTFISFATAPGQVAADGDQGNGLFTSNLLRHLPTPGIKLEEVFKRTTADVYRASGQRQAPWVQYSVIGDFYFVDGMERPPDSNQIVLNDLKELVDAEREAQLEQQRLQREWEEWQQRMQQDYERVLAFEKQAVGSELKIESWQRFLSNWGTDNPYSQQDTELRSGAQAKLSYWLSTQKVQLKPENVVEAVPDGELARRKLEKTGECESCDFSRAYFKNSDLSNTNLTRANFSNAYLKYADLRFTRLNAANLTNANLVRANLVGAQLNYAILLNVDMTSANLSRAKLTNTNLTGVNLSGANLIRANLANADLTGANLSNVNLSGANLTNTNLTGVNLSGMNLSGAKLTNAQLNSANLSKTDLTNTDLSGANLFRANFNDADVGSFFKANRSKYCKTKMPDGSINNRDC